LLLATSCSISLQPTHSTLQTYVPWRIKQSIHKQKVYNPMDNEGLKQNKKGKKASKAKNWLSKVLKHCKILKFQCTLACQNLYVIYMQHVVQESVLKN
jgi:hypothetical protein